MRKLLLIYLFLSINLFSLEYSRYFGFVSAGVGVVNPVNSDISMDSLSIEIGLPKVLFILEKPKLGISLESLNMYYYPSINKFDLEVLNTSLLWYFYNSNTYEKHSDFRIGAYGDISFKPLSKTPYDSHVGVIFSDLSFGIAGELKIGYSLTSEEFYLVANRDFFLTYIYLFTSAP